MKSQIAIEYIILIAVFLLFLTPVWIYSFKYTNNMKLQLATDYAQELVDTIGDLSDFVYSQGSPAAMTFEGVVPDYVYSTSINGSLIVISLNMSSGLKDVYSMCNSNVTGHIPLQRGKYIFLIKADRGFVNVTVQ